MGKHKVRKLKFQLNILFLSYIILLIFKPSEPTLFSVAFSIYIQKHEALQQSRCQPTFVLLYSK